MSRLGFVIASGLLLASTSAFAQSAAPSITSVETSAGTIVYPGYPCIECLSGGITFPIDVGYGAGSATFPNAAYPGASAQGSAMWNSFVDSTSEKITFESSNALTGAIIGAESTSTVQIGLANGSGVNLHSTITPAALGFYVADVGDGSCILSGTCAQVAPQSAYDFAAFAAQPGDLLAVAGFDFTVFTSASGFDDHTLFSVHGELTLGEDGSLIIFSDLGEAMEKLNGFGLQTPPAGGVTPYHSLGYNWDETGFDVGGLFETGFQTITYQTSVYSYSAAPCLSNGTGMDAGVTACLLAYSGFGDPIGRGVSELSFADFLTALDGPQILNHGDDDLITGLNFSPFTIDAPRIVNGTLFVGGGNSVPEPATWAMLILGFGGIGATLRRRRVLGASI